MKIWVHGLCFATLLGTASCAAPSDEGADDESGYTGENDSEGEAQLLGSIRREGASGRHRWLLWRAKHRGFRRPHGDGGASVRGDDDSCDDEEDRTSDEPTLPDDMEGDDAPDASTPTAPTWPTGPTVTPTPRTPTEPTVTPTTPTGPTVTPTPRTPTEPTVTPTTPTGPTVTPTPRTPTTPATPPAACTSLTYENFARAFMTQYCVACHSSPSGLGGVDVSSVAAIAARKGDIDAHAVKTPANKPMPPAGMPQPTDAERKQLGEWLSCGPN